MTARLLLVDDEPELLELMGDWFVGKPYELATATNGVEALARMRERPFDVIVTDLKMPGMGGLELLDRVKELDPEVQVVILSGQGTMRDAIEALREGKAFDFLQKPLPNLRELETAIERALARRRGRVAPAEPPPNVEPLTPREVEVVQCLARGLDNRAIADALSVSEKTIKNQLTRIYEKLGVKNRTQAVLLCQQLGWI
jgi:DNA-binding NarL/FixJ family response regulator